MPPDPESRRDCGNWTVPNLLTALRIVFTPVFVFFYLNRQYGLALGMFFVCGATDALDGFLARTLNQRSRLGGVLDPLADKVLLVASYVCLAQNQWLPVWLAAVVVGRDAVILGGAGVVLASGREASGSLSPSLLGKGSTALQMVTVLAAFATHMTGGGGGALEVLAGLTGAVSLCSGIDYLIRGAKLLAVRKEDG